MPNSALASSSNLHEDLNEAITEDIFSSPLRPETVRAFFFITCDLVMGEKL